MKQFRVVYKDVDTMELMQETVSMQVAAECQKKMGTSQGVYVGNCYIKGSAISKIEEVISKDSLLAAPNCGKCDKGFLFGKDGAYPCSCNMKGRETAREYAGYLSDKEWNVEHK